MFAEDSPERLIGYALSVVAETGSMPEYTMKDPRTKEGGTRVLVKKYRGPLGGSTAEVTWQRLFLSRVEAAALAVLIMAEYGWNLSVIDRLAVPKASSDADDDGRPTYRVQLKSPDAAQDVTTNPETSPTMVLPRRAG